MVAQIDILTETLSAEERVIKAFVFGADMSDFVTFVAGALGAPGTDDFLLDHIFGLFFLNKFIIFCFQVKVERKQGFFF